MAPKRELFVAAGDGGAAPPQEKRLRVEAAPGSSSRPDPPSSPRHFLAIVLVVLFLKRPYVSTVLSRSSLISFSVSLTPCRARAGRVGARTPSQSPPPSLVAW